MTLLLGVWLALVPGRAVAKKFRFYPWMQQCSAVASAILVWFVCQVAAVAWLAIGDLPWSHLPATNAIAFAYNVAVLLSLPTLWLPKAAALSYTLQAKHERVTTLHSLISGSAAPWCASSRPLSRYPVIFASANRDNLHRILGLLCAEPAAASTLLMESRSVMHCYCVPPLAHCSVVDRGTGTLAQGRFRSRAARPVGKTSASTADRGVDTRVPGSGDPASNRHSERIISDDLSAESEDFEDTREDEQLRP